MTAVQIARWLIVIVGSLAVAVLVASRVRARGEYPEFDLDGEGPQ